MVRQERLRNAGFAALIVLGGLVAWWPAFRAGFVWDDRTLLLDSPLVRGPLAPIWLGTDAPDYWPLTWTSFWAEWRLWGTDPAPYHALNVVLHLVASLLLWRLLRALRIPGAAVAGLLFAVHPVAVESVAWVSERKNVLSGVFFFASLLAWARFDEGGRRREGVASLVLYLLALLAKTSVVMLPFVQLGIALWRRGTVTRRDLARTGPFFALSAAFATLTIWVQGANVVRGEVAARGMAERIGGAGWALLSYAQKAFVPFDLALVYPRWPADPRSMAWWLPTVVVLAASAAVLVLGRRAWARPVAFALGYHALMVLPVLGLLDMAYFSVAPVSNHLQYLALAAPCALAGAGLAQLHGRMPAVAVGLGAAAAIALGTWTFHRSAAFENELRLWTQAVRDAPGSFYAALSLAQELGANVSMGEAVGVLHAFETRSSDEADRHLARAHALVFLRRPTDAGAEAIAADALRPDVQRQIELGRFLVTASHAPEAVGFLADRAERYPRSADLRYWLAAALWRTGRPEEARKVVEDGLRAAPQDRKLREAAKIFRGPPGGKPTSGSALP
ncbi:MAG: tetratricopeptide repeat protein [Anaeromyxobacteraceae bacterium]